MDTLLLVGAFLLGLILLYLLSILLVVPLRIIGKLVVNGIIGFLLLVLFNMLGGFLFGFTIALTPINSLIAGFFGVPGVIGLAAFTFFF